MCSDICAHVCTCMLEVRDQFWALFLRLWPPGFLCMVYMGQFLFLFLFFSLFAGSHCVSLAGYVNQASSKLIKIACFCLLVTRTKCVPPSLLFFETESLSGLRFAK